MDKSLKIISLDDNPNFAAPVKAPEKGGLQVHIAVVGNCNFFSVLEREPFDIVVTEDAVPDCTNIQELHERLRPGIPFLLFSGIVGEQTVITNVKPGAKRYALKHHPERLVSSANRSWRDAQEKINQQQAEAELLRHGKLFRTLTANSPDLLTIASREGAFQYINPSSTRLLGYDPEELSGRVLFEFVHPEDRPGLISAFERCARDPQWRIIHEFRARRADGSWCYMEVVGQNRLGDPDIAGMVLNMRDVTERKELESKLWQAQKMEAIGQLAGGLAHDFNNILAPILMATQLLGEKLPEENKEKILATVKGCAQRGADIVRQLSWLARGSGGTRVLFSPKQVIRDLGRFVAETFPKSIRMETHVAPQVWSMHGDPTHLHQVLLNLCLNARDAMPTGGTLKIECSNFTATAGADETQSDVKPGPYVAFEVSDTGAGVPAEIGHRIFEPFFTTKEPGKGTGLGLANVMSIVKSYAGFIRLESNVGMGTTFRVYFPAKTETPAAEAEQHGSASPVQGHGETVLVVDDEESVLRLVQQALEKFGYRVLTAANGEQALTTYLANQDSIALVLTDLMMPVMDGIAMIRTLKQINPQVKIVAASGLGSHPHSGNLKELSVEHFLSKPYTIDILLEKLRLVLAE